MFSWSQLKRNTDNAHTVLTLKTYEDANGMMPEVTENVTICL
jgi:hypothetical protein